MRKTILAVVCVLSLVAGLASCSTAETNDSKTGAPATTAGFVGVDGLAFVIANTRNNPAPSLPDALKPVTYDVVAAGQTPLIYSATNTPSEIATKLLPINPKGTAAGNRSRIDENVRRVSEAFGTLPAAPGLNMFNALLVAHDALSESDNQLIVLVGSGLDDAERSSMNTTRGLLMADVQSIADHVKEQNPGLTLQGVVVVLVSFGYTAPPQQPLTPAQRVAVTAAWRHVLVELGATVEVIPSPNMAPSLETNMAVGLTVFAEPCVYTGSAVKYDLDSSLLPFDKGKWELGPEAGSALADAARLLNENPGAAVTIIGHTDLDGEAESNLTLGRNRASSVATYLRSKTDHQLDITVDSKGESEPKAPEAGLLGIDLEIAQAANRRIELTIAGTTTGCST
jgi:outer membrane protein OmpA-like peptidoglycan-associated protein